MTDMHASRGRRTFLASVVVLAGALALSLAAGASNATLRVTLDKWSHTVGADAHSVSLAAKAQHPRRMTSSALRFRRDALSARRAIAAQHPSTAAGRRGQKLALTAFADYAAAGSRWAATGRARVLKHRAAASRSARAATTFATTGNRLLVAAAKLVR